MDNLLATIHMFKSLLDSARTREMSHSLEETSPLSHTSLKPELFYSYKRVISSSLQDLTCRRTVNKRYLRNML
ncbi:unnamed protein product [Acanthoscelides obtectus]|uniref:Uncharacterized protein n=1 Tax=Acanthoscelides obtectus TaxID=200917 RepID=A0A9P0KLH8_ACAOB|nr:unnamed protein product [Acanthoscelides obtectus]CAK1631877.1 hypothetical protein AOBTE_LOCUS7220 [Acanthoscelides obtectus]